LPHVMYFRFVDDVMFSHSGLYGSSFVFLSGDSVTAATTTSIPNKIKISKIASWVARRGRSLPSAIACGYVLIDG